MDLDEAIHTPRIEASSSEITLADESMSFYIQEELRSKIDNLKFAPRSFYPYNFACPSGVARIKDENQGVTEIMSPWADTAVEGL